MARNKNVNLYDDDDYEDLYNYNKSEYSHKKPRKDWKNLKHKGHQSRSGAREEKWDNLEQEYSFSNELLLDNDSSSIRSMNKKPKLLGNARVVAQNTFPETSESVSSATTPTPGKFNFGPNSHEVKGNMIDFDKVVEISKVEAEHNGRITYGIKFVFSGKKGLYRIAWFNQQIKSRDAVFNTEYEFWKKLQK